MKPKKHRTAACNKCGKVFPWFECTSTAYALCEACEILWRELLERQEKLTANSWQTTIWPKFIKRKVNRNEL